jgi:subtilisin
MLIASAGNYGTNWVTYPAAYDTVQGVGATNALNQLPVFTDRGPGVDVWAPGTRILSTGDVVRDSVQTWFAYHEGTSYAAPLVTAAAILGRSLRSPSLGPGPVECTLRSSAYPPIDPVNGTGLLHVANFLATLPSSGPSPCDTRIPEAPPEVIPPPSSEDQFEGGGLVTPVLEPSAIP